MVINLIVEYFSQCVEKVQKIPRFSIWHDLFLAKQYAKNILYFTYCCKFYFKFFSG